MKYVHQTTNSKRFVIVSSKACIEYAFARWCNVLNNSIKSSLDNIPLNSPAQWQCLIKFSSLIWNKVILLQ